MSKPDSKTYQKKKMLVQSSETRRHFIIRLWGWLGLVAGIEMIWAGLSFFTPRKKNRRNSGPATYTPIAEVKDIPVNSVYPYRPGRLYLSRLKDGGFLALSLKCSHLGCPVTWDVIKEKFVCPCHASSFSIAGEVLSPPATRPLDRYPLRIENGTIYVDLSHPEPGKSVSPLQEGKS